MYPSASRPDATLSLPARCSSDTSAPRAWLASAITLALLSLVVWIFWREDWRYSRPTPRPIDLVQPALGAALGDTPDLAQFLAVAPARATLIHVFNPSCPCSRFNVDHVRELVDRYQGRVRFVALLQSDDPLVARRSFDALDLDVTAIVDDDGDIAARLGVYSTPQAVILGADGTLYYRGNYNRTRYCDDEKTEFARLALDTLLAGSPLPPFPAEAATAYGCALPDAASE